MKEIYNQLLIFWRGLAPRERLILGVGGAVAAVLLAYGLLWAPLQHDLDKLRVDVPREQQQLLWMRAQVNRVKQLRSAAPSGVQGGGLASFVEQSGQAYGIRPGIRPEGSNAVRLSVDNVGFNTLIEWLANLQKQGGVRVESANLEPLPTSGVVNARLLLRASGS